jgi:hypothetical protein
MVPQKLFSLNFQYKLKFVLFRYHKFFQIFRDVRISDEVIQFLNSFLLEKREKVLKKS